MIDSVDSVSLSVQVPFLTSLKRSEWRWFERSRLPLSMHGMHGNVRGSNSGTRNIGLPYPDRFFIGKGVVTVSGGLMCAKTGLE
jgi:hypothetical protein